MIFRSLSLAFFTVVVYGMASMPWRSPALGRNTVGRSRAGFQLAVEKHRSPGCGRRHPARENIPRRKERTVFFIMPFLTRICGDLESSTIVEGFRAILKPFRKGDPGKWQS